jgi:hypothetical protein
MEVSPDGGDRVFSGLCHRIVAEVEPLAVSPTRLGDVDPIEIEEECVARLQRVLEAVPMAGEEVPDGYRRISRM